MSRLATRTPDVLIVGTQRAMDSGLTVATQALRAFPRLPVLVLGSSDDAETVRAAVAQVPAVSLSMREMQVLTGMSQGKSNAQIGRELYLSEDTIKTHARRLFRKLGAKDRAEAVATGFRRGMMT